MVAISVIGLVFLPDTVPAVGMMAGGVAVIGGFISTLARYYLPQPIDESASGGDSSNSEQ